MASINPTISVILPNYNDSRYLPRCLNSLLEQKEPPYEIVIIDDASSDDSVSVIRKLIAGKSHARLIENSVNRGACHAFESAIDAISGDFVLPLSANDYVLPGIFSSVKAMLKEYPHAGIWSAMSILVNENDRTLGLHRSPLISSVWKYLPPQDCADIAYRVGSWFTSPTMIYRREALVEAGGFNPRYGGLSDLFIALVLSSRYGAVYSPGIYGALRLHKDGLLSKTLGDARELDTLLCEMVADGGAKAPLIFKKNFSIRFTVRIRFSAIRPTAGKIKRAIGKSSRGWRVDLLHKILPLVPSALCRIRVALAFLLLRPYDLLPILWYRFLKHLFKSSRDIQRTLC